MIIRTSKKNFIIAGAAFAACMVIFSIINNGFNAIRILIALIIYGFLFGGALLLLDKYMEKKAYYCRHKVELAQEVICQGNAAIRKSGFSTESGWMFLGNSSLDYYKIGAASGEKIIEIKLSDIASISAQRNVLTVNTALESYSFGVGQANEWKKQIEQVAQQADLTKEKPKNTADDTQELIKFKQLLDSGVISQEEFDAKKKQLLGL